MKRHCDRFVIRIVFVHLKMNQCCISFFKLLYCLKKLVTSWHFGSDFISDTVCLFQVERIQSECMGTVLYMADIDNIRKYSLFISGVGFNVCIS